MNYCYVEEKNIIRAINIANLKYYKDKILLNKAINKLSERRQRKIAKKLRRYLEKEEKDEIILSKELKRNKQFLNILKMQSIKIIDGRILMKYLAKEIVEYILKYINKEKQETRIAILSNELTDTVIEKIKIFALEYKEVTVVTNHPNKVMNLEKELYENFGTQIIITNNKKKALLKQDIILNFDFIEEIINKYFINFEAVIVNFEDKIKIKGKRFSGINIYNYEITCNSEKLEKYDIKDIIEGKTNFNTSFSNIRKMIKDKEIKIEMLITFRGNII